MTYKAKAAYIAPTKGELTVSNQYRIKDGPRLFGAKPEEVEEMKTEYTW